MKSRLLIVFIALNLLFTLLLLQTSNTYATSWKRLSPKEVVKRSEIVVQGKYLFPENNKTKKPQMWHPFKFKIEKYFKGSGQSIIEAAIEQSDIQWVQEEQENGKDFVLFLNRKDYKNKYWIPIGGPNGMLIVKKGEIQNYGLSKNDKKYYFDYLSKQKPTPPKTIKKPVVKLKNKIKRKPLQKNSFFIYLATALIIASLLAVFLFRRFMHTKH